MSKSMHTPGPWEVDPSYHWYERSVRPGKYHAQVRAMNGEAWTPIARCQSNAQSVDNEANARLIAAAPDLLNALIYLRDCIESGTEPAMSRVNAAIAKAEGRANA